MSLFDPDNPQHQQYRGMWRAAMERGTKMQGPPTFAQWTMDQARRERMYGAGRSTVDVAALNRRMDEIAARRAMVSRRAA